MVFLIDFSQNVLTADIQTTISRATIGSIWLKLVTLERKMHLSYHWLVVCKSFVCLTKTYFGLQACFVLGDAWMLCS